MSLSMQDGQQVISLDRQQLDAKQRLQTAQSAVKEQSQLLEQERASFSQSTELVEIEKLEDGISTAQEVHI